MSDIPEAEIEVFEYPVDDHACPLLDTGSADFPACRAGL